MDTGKLMLRKDAMEGQRILITGGGTGLGREMAEGALALGAEVHICGRRESVCEETARELMDAHGGTVIAHGCDIRQEGSIEDMMDGIWGRHGALTGLINNAAGNFIARTEDLSLKGFDAISSIVFRGTFAVTHNAGKRWIEAGDRASVVSILTTWVWNGGPFVVPSAMSKAAVNVMTQSLAVEWGPKGLRFNAIAPGAFPTPGMSDRLAPKTESGKAMRDMGQGNPMGRVGEMHELVNLATFLLAPGADYLNGQTIAIDGAAYNASGGNFSALSAWGDPEWEAARDAIRATNQKDRAKRTA